MATPDQVAQLIANSGNNFHSKVARSLRANGWHVVVSPYYMDQTQNKAREIDLVAEKLWPVTSAFGRHVDDVAIRLFVECKFVPLPSVFWFTAKDASAAEELVCASGPFRADNTYTQKHHYLAQSLRVAKLFTTDGGRGPESDPFYKALNQSLNAMVSLRGKPISVPGTNGQPPAVTAIVEFPVVVCSSFEQMYSVEFYEESTPTLIAEDFQLEVRYAYIDRSSARRDDYFLLDFVDFTKIERFYNRIGEDAAVAAFFASER